MKTVRLLISAMVLMLMGSVSGNIALAQQHKKAEKAQKIAAVIKMIAEQDYVFKAQSALPLTGGMRYLNTDYDLKITKNNIESYLPYFGRVYTAPISPTQGGIKFNAEDFEYTVEARKKGGWNVRIKPKDVKVDEMILSISESGFATLQVIPEQKQTITFNGYVEANKEEKVTAKK